MSNFFQQIFADGSNYLILIMIILFLPLALKEVFNIKNSKTNFNLLITLSLIITAYINHKFANLGWLALVISILSGLCAFVLTTYLIEEGND